MVQLTQPDMSPEQVRDYSSAMCENLSNNLNALHGRLINVADLGASADTAATLAHLYSDARSLLERIKQASEPLVEYVEKLGKERIPSAFEAEGLTTLTTQTGYRVTISMKYVASIRPDMKGKAYQWLRANGLGELIIETVNASTLTGAAKVMIEDKNVELPADLFNSAILPQTSMTKVKPK